MSRCHRLACLVVLLVFAAPVRTWAAGEFRSIEVDSLRITVDSEWIGGPAPGYVPIRWEISNDGGDREIEIAGDGNRISRTSFRYRDSRPRVRQRIRLAAGDRVRFTMSVPVGGDSDNIRFQIRENGRTIQTLGFVGMSRFGGISALIVSARDGSYASLATGWVRPPTTGVPGRLPGGVIVAGRAGGRVGGPTRDLVLEPSRLPTSWLGYTSVQSVVVGPREWELMEAPQRAALLTWTAAGGDLVLADADLSVLFPDASQRPNVTDGVAEHFFGRIHLFPSTDIDAAGFDNTLASIEKRTPDPSWVLPLRPIATGTGTGFRLPIPGVDGVPAGAYLTLLTLFAVLIGPVNHIVLRRRQQQALIVLTTPLIAAVFIVLLGGYVVAIEGFGIRGRILSLTLLDQEKSQAVTRATVSLYAAGRAPSGGLRFPRDVAVFPTPVDGAPPVGEMLDLSEVQQFSSGLLMARSPSNFETIAFRPARERLSFTVENGRVRVSNGLGATVSRLRFRDRGRSYSLAASLQPGAASLLQETSTSARELLSSDSVMARFDSVVTNLADSSYLAVVDRTPFWSAGPVDIEERGSFHLVLGRVASLP